LEVVKVDVAMNSSSESESRLDRWRRLLAILYGVLFVSVSVTFSADIVKIKSAA
jgi:hypothetical protein